MASEVGQLSLREKLDVVGQVVATVADRVPVIGGASAHNPQEQVGLAAELINLGCAGILVPIDSAADPIAIERDLAKIVELEPGFLMVQDWDANGQGLPMKTISRLFQRIERFNWIKIEVQNAGPKYTDVLNEFNGELGVAGGWAVTQMIDGLDRGVHAFMPTAMHNIYVEIYRRYAAGEREEAERLFARIKPVLAFSNQSLDISIRFFKRMLHAQGVYATPNVRLSGTSFGVNDKRRADELIEQVSQLQAEITEPPDLP